MLEIKEKTIHNSKSKILKILKNEKMIFEKWNKKCNNFVINSF